MSVSRFNGDLEIDFILSKVRESGVLGKAKRQLELFRYICVKSFEGQADYISPYDIAFDVLGRGSDFDANSDSIVRVEMHRLRKNLEMFNKQDHEFAIVLPKASFSLEICERKRAYSLSPINNFVLAFGLGVISIIFLILLWVKQLNVNKRIPETYRILFCPTEDASTNPRGVSLLDNFVQIDAELLFTSDKSRKELRASRM